MIKTPLKREFKETFDGKSYGYYFQIHGGKKRKGYGLVEYVFQKSSPYDSHKTQGHVASRIEQKNRHYVVHGFTDLLAVVHTINEADEIAYDFIVKEAVKYLQMYPGYPLIDITKRGKKRKRKLRFEIKKLSDLSDLVNQ